MKVAIDTNSLYVSQAGTSRYVRGLLRGLRSLSVPDIDFFELAWPVANLEYQQPWRSLKTVYREWIWGNCVAPVKLARQRTDILHRCTLVPIRHNSHVKEVVTLYDLGVLRHPERYRPWHRFSQTHRLRIMRRAERIICISRFTAQEAMTLLAIPASKLETIYLGSDFAPDMSPAQEQKPAFNVPERFFLFVGSIEPGKNLALLKAAYTIAMARHIEVPPLVIVGVRWEGVAREDAPPAAWQYVGYQPDATLCWLYHRALALVFPSKYEGFGLPVLEAMSLGCPVICSQVAGLPEVGGSAVWYADQTPEAYMNAMMELSRDDTIRKHLQEAGYRQSRKFSWRLCAQETCEVYRKIIQS